MLIKKIVVAALICMGVLLSGPALLPAWAGDVPKWELTVNGQIINDGIAVLTQDQVGNITGQTVLWPLRRVAEALGYTVTWDGQAAKLIKDTTTVVVGPADKAVLIYRKESALTGDLDVATRMKDDHIYIEEDFFAKYLGAKFRTTSKSILNLNAN